MESKMNPVMMLLVYRILIYLFCVQFQTGLCGVGHESKKQTGAADVPRPTEHATCSDGTEPIETIKWPFSEENFKHPIQSPIDVITSFIKKNDKLEQLTIHEPLIPNVEAVVYNDGNTVKVEIAGVSENELPYLMGGPIKKNEKFYFEQMHFHWGRKDEWGSEHMVDGQAFSVEIHMVHFNSKYTTFDNAKTKGDGLAVLTIFAEAESEDKTSHNLLKPLHDLLPDLKTPNVKKSLPWNKALEWAISGMEINQEYYTYPGSLTTFPFCENVAFILLPKPISISHEQLQGFRELNHKAKEDSVSDNQEKQKTGPITHNNRKLQPNYHRPIFKGKINFELELRTKS